MKKTKLLYLLPMAAIFSICSLTSCNFVYNKLRGLKFIDIADAKSLFVGPKLDSTKKSATITRAPINDPEETTFYKIKEDGSVLEVEYHKKNGNPYKIDYIPQIIRNVNDDYIFIAFEQGYDASKRNQNMQFLLNKKSNRCYQVPPGFKFYDRYFDKENYTKYLDQEIFYNMNKSSFIALGEYPRGDSSYQNVRLCKVDYSNPDDLKISPISAETDRVMSFAADKEGNAIYQADTNGGYVNRMVTKDGEFYNVNSYNKIWTGLDGYIYTSDQNGISKVVLKDGKIEYEQYSNFRPGVNSNLVVLEGEGKILTLSTNRISEIFNFKGTYITYTTSDLTGNFITLRDYTATSKELFVSALNEEYQPVFGKFSFNGDLLEWKSINTNGIDITTLTSSEDGSVSFSGVDMQNGSYVIGNVTTDDQIEITLSNLSSEIVSMIEI